MKTIEVILAAYNGSNYIREQIYSILSSFDKLQGYDCSILISDDASTDSTIEIIKSISVVDRRVILVDEKKKGGVKDNFSCLIGKSNADYVFFSDQDDLWLPDKIPIFMDRFNVIEENFRGPILIHSDLCVADKNLSPINVSMFKYQNINKSPEFPQLLVSNSITGCVMACNRELIEKIKSSNIKDSIMHDWYIGLFASAFGLIDFIDKSLILYRQHGGNQVGAKSFSLQELIKTRNIKDKISQTKRSILKTKKQAEVFLTDFSKDLDNEDKKLLEEYINSFNGGIMNRYNLFTQRKVKKQGKIRNLFFFVFYVVLGGKINNK